MSTEPAEAGFSAFASFLGTPLPEDPIRALRILRKEVAAEIERLIGFLDAMGGDPDMEPGGDEEPTLGWPVSGSPIFGFGSQADGELEPSLGWTGTVNQTSSNRLGDGEDYEKDDADKEESDHGEDNGDLEPSLGQGGNGNNYDLEGDDCDFEDGRDTEEAVAPSLEYVTALRARRGQPSGHCTETGFHNVGPIENLSLVIIGPDGKRQEIDRLGYPGGSLMDTPECPPLSVTKRGPYKERLGA